MPKQYQVIQANNTDEMERFTRAMEAQGYVPVGSIICGVREETHQHIIKGAITKNVTYLKQSFWYAPNVDSAFDCLVKQHQLLQSVVDMSQCASDSAIARLYLTTKARQSKVRLRKSIEAESLSALLMVVVDGIVIHHHSNR